MSSVWRLDFFLNHEGLKFRNFESWKVEGGAPDNYEESRINFSNILDMNFISIKNMKWKLSKSYKLLYFQGRESSNINQPKVRETPSTYRLPPLHPSTRSSHCIFLFDELHPSSFTPKNGNSRCSRSFGQISTNNFEIYQLYVCGVSRNTLVVRRNTVVKSISLWKIILQRQGFCGCSRKTESPYFSGRVGLTSKTQVH